MFPKDASMIQETGKQIGMRSTQRYYNTLYQYL